MYILGILIFAIGVLFMLLLGTAFEMGIVMQVLFDIPTTFLFVVFILSVVISTNNFKTLVVAINALLSKKYNLSAAYKDRAIKLFKLIGKTVIYATFMITVMSIILILHNSISPDNIGPMFSIALQAVFQGTMINLILVNPAINILQARYNSEEKIIISEKQVIDKLLELCYRQGVSPDEVLEAREISFKK